MASSQGSATTGGSGRDPRSAVVADLARRADELARRPGPSAEQLAREREREKLVVHECRYLMRLLATRRRSAGEMRRRLVEREVSASVIHEVLARIDRAGLIDDEAFAAEWVGQRRALRGLSDEALRRELRDRGIEASVIENALIDEESDEEERARALVRDRLRRERDLAQASHDADLRARLSRRLDGYLRRRGYDGALALRVVTSELLHLTGR